MMFSCKPQVPGKYIQPDDFEDLLYDFHLADGMAENEEDGTTDAYAQALNRQAALRKHGVTQAEFDSSLVYYMRHADRLHKIYENLSKRLSDEALALGASANDISRYGDLKSARDTSNLWKGVSSCVLMPDAPYNVMSFEITADSTYHKGDKIILSFNTDFIFRDGPKDVMALLALEYKNDSVASSHVRVSSNSNYSVTVADNDMKGIKAIKGFIYFNKPSTERKANDLRLLSVYNIHLVRLRGGGQPTQAAPETKPLRTVDTLARPKQDTLGRQLKPLPANNLEAKPMRPDGKEPKPQPNAKPLKLEKRKLFEEKPR